MVASGRAATDAKGIDAWAAEHDEAAYKELWRASAPLLIAWFNDLERRRPADAADVHELLTKRETEPGVEGFILSGMQDHEPSQRRRKEMISALVVSMMSGDGFRPFTHAKEMREEDGYDPRTRQRFFTEDFASIFPEVTPRDKPADARATARTSISAPEYAAASPVLRAMGERAYQIATNPDTMLSGLSLDEIHACRLTNAIVVQDILDFQKEALLAIGDAMPTLKQPLSTLAKEFELSFRYPTDILIMLHAHVTGILGAEWFLGRHANTRREYLQVLHPLGVTREDADKAFLLVKRLYENEEAAVATFERAALPFVKAGDWAFGFILFERAYLSPASGERARGAFVGNMGQLAKRGGHLDEALFCFKRSIEHHAAAKDAIGLFQAFRDLAEALWPTKRDEGRGVLRNNLKMLSRLPPTGRALAIRDLVEMFERLDEQGYAGWSKSLANSGDLAKLDTLPDLDT